MKVLDRANVSQFMVYVLREFAKEKRLQIPVAYEYLAKYKGINFLETNYGYEHTLGILEIIEDITEVCKKHGGNIA